jgi:biotin transport system permease protein
MLSYVAGNSLAHRLDPRSKLAVQFGFAIAVFVAPTPPWLVAMGALALGVLATARLSPLRALYAYRFVLLVLAAGPVIAAISLSAPSLRVEPALASVVAISRVLLVLLVSAAYVHTTPVRDTRAAIQRHVPGRTGQLLGVGVGLTMRFFPLVLADVRRIRAAIHARGGAARSLRERARLVVEGSLRRTFARSDRLALALQARCFAWNPTLPHLAFGRLDYPALALGVALAVSPILRVLV